MLNDNIINTKPMVEIKYVQSDFFLNRIHEFETKYSMPWQQFVAEYSTGNLPGACKNTDFAEWDFLCTNFAAELLKPSDAGPPAEEQSFEGQKPELISGFFLFRTTIVRPRRLRQQGEYCSVDVSADSGAFDFSSNRRSPCG